MKLHMHKISTTSRPILLFCSENKIDIETVIVDLMVGEHMQEPFAKLNPSKQVPVLEDGDFVLTESSAILKYLADKIDSPAYPKEPRSRAHVNELMDWFNTGFYREYGYHLVYPQVYPHHVRSPEDSNKVTVEWGREQCKHWLSVLNDHWLGPNRKYLTGGDITIADYFGSVLFTPGDLIGESFKGYDNVNRWLNTMKSLPSWNTVNDVHYGFAGSLKDKQFVTIT